MSTRQMASSGPTVSTSMIWDTGKKILLKYIPPPPPLKNKKTVFSHYIVKWTKILVQIMRFTCCLNMGFSLTILKMSPDVFVCHNTESIATRTDHYWGFRWAFCWNQVKYAWITITHVCFIVLTLARSPGRCLNTRPNGLVFKQLPRDPENVNTRKNVCDPYIIYRNATGLTCVTCIQNFIHIYRCMVKTTH